MREEDALSRIPALKTWFRTSRAVVLDVLLNTRLQWLFRVTLTLKSQVMHLTNGTMQINFFKDHTKVIVVMALASGKLTSIVFVPDHSLPTFGCSHLHWWGAEEQDLQVGRFTTLDLDCLPRLFLQVYRFNIYQRFDLLEKHGCTTELASRLTYAYDKVGCEMAVIIWALLLFWNDALT